MSKQAWTPGPWKINWFNCTANVSDVAYARSKGDTQLQVGHTFWRVARSIGPITIDSNHWSGDHLDVSEADARLITAAPEMAEALEALASAFMSNTRWSGEPPVEVANARAILARINGEPGR